jgi:hypothetical protein
MDYCHFEGHIAFLDGKPRDACPYPARNPDPRLNPMRNGWFRGWDRTCDKEGLLGPWKVTASMWHGYLEATIGE